MKNLEIDYKNLHKIPEIGFNEYKTKEYILNRLKNLNCDIYEIGNTSIIAYFNNHQEKVIAFRAELDGLNILEETKLEYEEVIFDSECCDWRQQNSTFDERIIGKQNLIFLIEDDKGNKFGGFISSKIEKKRNETKE